MWKLQSCMKSNCTADRQRESKKMRCEVWTCIENDDGYCLSPEHVSIDENGECNLMVLFPPEKEEENNGF